MAKVGVALSGGVDSSVAALILQQQGHEVVGLPLGWATVLRIPVRLERRLRG